MCSVWFRHVFGVLSGQPPLMRPGRLQLCFRCVATAPLDAARPLAPVVTLQIHRSHLNCSLSFCNVLLRLCRWQRCDQPRSRLIISACTVASIWLAAVATVSAMSPVFKVGKDDPSIICGICNMSMEKTKDSAIYNRINSTA